MYFHLTNKTNKGEQVAGPIKGNTPGHSSN
jgi:hypothetical protein